MRKRKRSWQYDLENLGDRIAEKVGRGLDKMAEHIDNIHVEIDSDADLDAHIQEAHFNESIGDTRSAIVNLHMGIGKLTVNPTEDDDTLFKADLRYIGDAHLHVEGGDGDNPTKTITLNQKSRNIKIRGKFSSDRHQLYNHIQLNPRIPTYLALHGGVSSSELNLAQLHLTGLTIEGGVGEMRVHLPSLADAYRVAIEGGVGRTRLHVPDDAAIVIDIDEGVGGTVIHVPATAAVSLEVNGTLGGISVPDHLKQVRHERRFVKTGGLWQTDNYATASRKVTIRTEGGVGALKIKTQEDETQVV